MVLPDSIKAREDRKFVEDTNGGVAVNTVNSESNALLLEIKNQNDLLRQLLILGAGLQSLNNVDTGGRQYVGVGSIASGMTLAAVTTIGSLSNLSGVLPSSNIVNELNVQSFQSIRNNINVY